MKEKIPIEQLISKAEEIIVMCEDTITKGISPNIRVIQIIRDEFRTIERFLVSDGKVILLNPRKDLLSTWTITDSAYYEYDADLFKKVFEFGRICKKLKKERLIFQYHF